MQKFPNQWEEGWKKKLVGFIDDMAANNRRRDFTRKLPSVEGAIVRF